MANCVILSFWRCITRYTQNACALPIVPEVMCAFYLRTSRMPEVSTAEGQHCVKGTEPEKSRPTELANVSCNESPQYDRTIATILASDFTVWSFLGILEFTLATWKSSQLSPNVHQRTCHNVRTVDFPLLLWWSVVSPRMETEPFWWIHIFGCRMCLEIRDLA